MNKVRAFTLMEVTVAMLIAALVIGISYTVYNIVAKTYAAYNTKSQDLALLIRLDELLKNDFDQADLVLQTPDGLLCQSATKLVNYTLAPEYIVRISGVTDTFKIKTRTCRAFFERGELQAGEPQTLDELELTLFFEDQNIPYHYRKHYSAVSLSQRPNNASN